MTQVIQFVTLTLLNVFLSANVNALAIDNNVNGNASTSLNNIERILERQDFLERYVREQDVKLAKLESVVTSQKAQLKSVNRRLAVYEQGHGNASLCKTSATSENGQNASHVHGIARRAQSQKVAFSAYLDHPVHHLGLETTVPFNQVILNDGGRYNPYTGIFTVPVNGVYLFTYTVNTWNDSWQLVVKLVLDNVNMSDGISDPKHDLQEVQGGNTVMFRAQAGQSVWVVVYNTGDVTVDGRDTHRFTTFSGVLLYEI